jgi:hypothetical protein
MDFSKSRLTIHLPILELFTFDSAWSNGVEIPYHF